MLGSTVWRRLSPWFAATVLTACGDSPSLEGETLGGGATAGGGATTGADAGSAGSSDAGSSGTAADTETGGSDGVCETVLCGPEGVCCGSGEECIADACRSTCESGVRCGPSQEQCCGEGEVCLMDSCVAGASGCLDSFDCDFDQFCEPTLAQCLPQQTPVTCEYKPEFEELEVQLEWAFTSDEVISIPVVADIRGNDAPEVVVNLTQKDGLEWWGGEIVVLDGRTGDELLRIPHDPGSGRYGTHGRATIGLADVGGDERPDIVYAGRRNPGGNSLIHAVDGDGDLLWTSHGPNGAPYGLEVENGAPSFANLDDDPQAEIVFGAAVLDHDGLVVWDQETGGNGATFGSNDDYIGGISAIADLTDDGYPEIVSGRHAWSVTWLSGGGTPNVTLSPLWIDSRGDGYPAIADIDGNGTPEVILVAEGTMRVLDGLTGQLWCGIDPSGAACSGNPGARTQPIAIPGGGLGGPPTVADFDGDGRPEVAAAGGSSYTVYDFYRDGEDVSQAVGNPEPGEAFVRWTSGTQDQSSNVTGSSVFDFQGDGSAEVVYQDECFMRVYAGTDGDALLELPNSSATIHEYPLVVDVDADGNSEIIVIANDSGNDCDGLPNYEERRGVYVYGDAFDQWVKTRKVWTSHTYHVTNVESSGNVPLQESDNWTNPALNNYRQNVQGQGVFNAPDLSIELAISHAECLNDKVVLIATVFNEGSLGVEEGIAINLYKGADASATVVGTEETEQPLLPGSFVTFSRVVDAPAGPTEYFAAVDGNGNEVGLIDECNEANNISAFVEGYCPVAG